ncbi:MAG: tetratricopeptide repeat protein [bacterium]
MRCRECGRGVPLKALHCPACGAPVGAIGKTVRTRHPAGRRNWLILAVVMTAITAGFFIFKKPLPVAPGTDGESRPHSSVTSDEMDDIGQILQNMPTDYGALVEYGNQFMDQADFAVAAECYRKALTLQEDFGDVRVDYGACLHGMGLPYRAIEEFQKVLKADPSHSIAHFNLGIVFYDLQQADSARVHWQEYLLLDPNGRAAAQARELLEQIGD